MSAKFLHRLKKVMDGYDRSTFTRADYEDILPYLNVFLANIPSRIALERFFQDFPEALQKLQDRREYDNALYLACQRDTPLLPYLMEHTPGGKDFYELEAEDKFHTLANAAYAGSSETAVKLLLKKAPKDLTAAFAKKHAYIIGEFYRNTPENAIPALLRLLPREDAIAVIKHENKDDSCRYLLLHEMLEARHFDEFKEFFFYLPEDEQRKCLASMEIMHALNFCSPDILDAVIDITGKEAVKEAYGRIAKEHTPMTVTYTDPETHESNTATSTEIPEAFLMIRNASRYPEDLKRAKKLLDLYEAEETDRLISLLNFHVAAQALVYGQTDYFRLLHDHLSTEGRKHMFESPFVKGVLHYYTLPKNAASLEKVADIIPPSYVDEARKNKDLYVAPEPVEPAAEEEKSRKPRLENDKELFARLKQHPEFKPELYAELLPYLKIAARAETGLQPKSDTAKLAVLFNSMRTIDRYLSNSAKGYGGAPPNQPIHEACQFTIPHEPFDVAHWRSAILQHGPAAARYLGLAPKIEAYAKRSGLRLPKTPPEMADMAQYVGYDRAGENLRFAHTCLAQRVSEEQFNRCLDVLSGKATVTINDAGTEVPVILKSKSDLPDITIDGADIGHPSYYMRRLNVAQQVEQRMLDQMEGSNKPLSDVEIATILGEFSHCCQSVGKAGEIFALHGLTSPEGDFYVWMKKLTDKSDQIVAQSWAWKAQDADNPDTMVFDSIEPLGNAHNHIFADFMLEFDRRAKAHGITHVNIGQGGKTPKDLPFVQAEKPARLREFDFENTGAEYDSQTQWVVRLADPDKPDQAQAKGA